MVLLKGRDDMNHLNGKSRAGFNSVAPALPKQDRAFNQFARRAPQTAPSLVTTYLKPKNIAAIQAFKKNGPQTRR